MILPPWLTIAGRFLRAVPPIVWVGLLAVVFAVSSAHYREQRNEARKALAHYREQRNEARKALAQHIAADEAALKLARRAAKAAEAAQRKAMADAVARYEKDKRDAIRKERAVADALRRGALRLRQQWRGCESGAQAAAGGQGGDGSAELRAESAGRIVRAAADADAQVTYLQGLIRSAPQCFVVQP